MKRNSYTTIIIIAIALMMTVFVGCDKRVFEADSFEIRSLTKPDSLYSGVETQIRAQVVDRDTKVPASGQTVTFRTNLGEIQAQVETNEFGIATTTFVHNVATRGNAEITASIHKDTKTVSFPVIPHPSEYIIRTITAVPAFIFSDGNRTTSQIRVVVKDRHDNMAVVEKQVSFTTDLGTIRAVALTDSSGVAVATFRDNWDLGTAKITAKADKHVMTVNVDIRPVEADYGIVVSATPQQIYADNNITYSTVTARVRDKEGFPVPEQIVRFKADIGEVDAQVITDGRGIATTRFYDGGDGPGAARIFAYINDVKDSTVVNIIQTPPVASIELEDVPRNLSLDQNVTLRARALNNLNDAVSDGTRITFSASKGSFQDNELEGGNDFGYTNDGYASVVWNTGTLAGNVSLTAKIGTVDSTVTSVIRPGPPASISAKPEMLIRVDGQFQWLPLPPKGIEVNYGGDVRVSAEVEDEYGNPVLAGIPINFETEIGSIQPRAATNDLGIARVFFYPGSSAGTNTVVASTMDEEIAGVTVFHIYTEDVHSISFVQDEQIYLDVKETGGTESAQLQVELRDFSGNRISSGDEPKEVRFRIVNGPGGGENINNQWGLNQWTQGIYESDGVATVSINSGYESGTVQVQVQVDTDQGVRSATKSNIVIRSGPPVTIKPFIGDFNQGSAIGGGMWKVQAGAILKDQWGNEVINGTTVHFSLGNNPPPPSTVSIEGGGYVGNPSEENEDGDPGIAYTYLYYHGDDINKEIQIIAASGQIIGSARVIMPLQEPNIDINILAPGAINFFIGAQGTTDPIYHDVYFQVKVTDGYNRPVADQVVLLNTNLGELLYDVRAYTPEDPPKPQRIKTLDGEGLFGERGIAYSIVRVFGWEISPPEDEHYTPDDVRITATLEGMGVQTETTFRVRRYNMYRP